MGKLDKHTFRIEQECDRSLDLLREKAAREDSYYFKEGLLYRQAKKDNGTDQLVVPCSLRELVMKCCHDIPIAGHMGIGATKKRVCSRFSWPGVMQDIIRFVKSCITCQKHCNKLPRLPVQQADIVDRPFDKVAIDIVGPLTVTDNKCRYILTLIDTATRWPEAVPLREIHTTDVASALFNIFSRLGLPKQILSDNGQQLVSKAMSEVMEMMGIERKLSTPYHAQSEPILQVPDMSKPFVVQSDASNKALGAVLLQEHEGSLLPCFYASRRLLDREINYAIIEKETLGIVFALNKFSNYLLMRPFYIQTDHKPLSFLNKNKSRSARLTRWALSIQQYSFTVQHIRGVNNVVSDALSRIY